MFLNNTIVRRIILLGSPLILGILQLWHPAHVAFNQLLPIVDWWLFLHLIQLPLFGLLAFTVYGLIHHIDHLFAKISKVALAIFVVFYTALDAVLGISGGIIIQYAAQLPAGEQAILEGAYIDLFMKGNELLGNIAVYSWFVAGISAAVALYIKGANQVGVLFLGLGTLLYHSHAYPYGPMGMAALVVAVICFEFFSKHRQNTVAETT
jgi:hypothetical protein